MPETYDIERLTLDERRAIARFAEAAAPLFLRMGWRWRGEGSPPLASDIAAAIVDLWHQCDEPGTTVYSGRLYVAWPLPAEDEEQSPRRVGVEMRLEAVDA